MTRTAAFGVVFDLDGTLIDSRADIAAAVNHALAHGSRAPLPVATIATYVGDGARALVARAAALDANDPRLETLLSSFLGYYRAHAVVQTTLMPHALEALGALSALPLALCTNKPRAATDLVIRRLLPEGVFRVIVAGDDLPSRKPDPECLHLVAREFGIGPQRLVLIGDGPQDVECARAASAQSIAVTNGFASERRLAEARPTRLVRDLRQAVEAVHELTRPGCDTRP